MAKKKKKAKMEKMTKTVKGKAEQCNKMRKIK